jgi:hypothetical protein
MGGNEGSIQHSACAQHSATPVRASDDLWTCDYDFGDSFVRSPVAFVRVAIFENEQLVWHSRWSFAGISFTRPGRVLARRAPFWLAPDRDCTAHAATQILVRGWND